MKAHFTMMARYNTWANALIYQAAGTLDEGAAWRDEGAFFGSVAATLNHIMLGDLIWLARFRGVADPPYPLDHVLHEDRAELWAARRVLDADIERFAAELTEDALAGTFTYRRGSSGAEYTQSLSDAVAHFFNHQTHHRGQVHALVTRIAGDAPSLDMIAFQREAA